MNKKAIIKNDKKLYFLDENDINLFLLQQMLEEKGYDIINVNQITELLKELRFESSNEITNDINVFNNASSLILKNIPSKHKTFFNDLALATNWIIHVLNRFNISFGIVYKNKYILTNYIFHKITELEVSDLYHFQAGDTVTLSHRKKIKDNIYRLSNNESNLKLHKIKITTKTNKIHELKGIGLSHQIDNVNYVAFYHFSSMYHNIDNPEHVSYLKLISQEMDSIFSNLIKINQIEKGMYNDNILQKSKFFRKIKNTYSLTEREYEVLVFICKGLTNKEIAERLFISKRTVESHRARILEKTQTKNTAELIRFAYTNKIVIE
jgi:DNA-binding CsgD family transcriptional regulator